MGINSGTSADGVDAAICRVIGRGLRMRVEYLGMVSRRYPAAVRARILAVMAPTATRTEEIGALQRDIGLIFLRTGRAALRQLGLKRVDFIGAHGQTVAHFPPQRRAGRKDTTGWSLQLGDPTVIATGLNAPVVANFRQADLAVGGQGAPLVPWTDFVLFGDKKRSRVLQNIGGIANLTYLPAGGGPEDVFAFDSGPGNMVMDALTQRLTKGRAAYDKGGRLAARGKVDEAVLTVLLAHPYFRRKPPKSCGREEFGAAYVDGLMRTHARRKLGLEDWLATATALTARSIALAYEKIGPIDDVILCGGGAKNKTLVAMLREQLAGGARLSEGAGKVRHAPMIASMDDYGIPSQAKECVSFAMLAAARMDGIAANLRQVTGARRAVVLGGMF